MRFKKSIIVSLLISSFSLSGCNLDPNNSEWNASAIKSTKLLDNLVDKDDFYDKAEKGFSLSEYPDVTFYLDRKTSELKANEEVIHYCTYGLTSLYVADFNKDGFREICICFGVGSGITDMRIDIYDYHNSETIFELSHRGGYQDQGYDYYLFLDESNYLCVEETLMMNRNEKTRTGRFVTDTNGEISVFWQDYHDNGNNNSSSSSSSNPREYKESIDLKDYYSWIKDLKEEDITMVISGITHGSISPRLDILDEYYYSVAASEFHRVYQYLNSTKILFNNPDLTPGTGTKSLTIVTNEQKYTINTNVDGWLSINGEYATVNTSLPSFDLPYGNSFMWHALLGMEVLDMSSGNIVTNDFKNISSMRYVIFEDLGDVLFLGVINSYNIYKFENSLGYIIFESPTDFYVCTADGKYNAYRIVNEITFDYLCGV